MHCKKSLLHLNQHSVKSPLPKVVWKYRQLNFRILKFWNIYNLCKNLNLTYSFILTPHPETSEFASEIPFCSCTQFLLLLGPVSYYFTSFGLKFKNSWLIFSFSVKINVFKLWTRLFSLKMKIWVKNFWSLFWCSG